jgi:hypothetical protein
LESLVLGLDQSTVTLRYTGQDLHDLIRPPALRNIFATVRELVSRYRTTGDPRRRMGRSTVAFDLASARFPGARWIRDTLLVTSTRSISRGVR